MECINGFMLVFSEFDEFCDVEVVCVMGCVEIFMVVVFGNLFVCREMMFVIEECKEGVVGGYGMVGVGCVDCFDFLCLLLFEGFEEEVVIGFNLVKFGVIVFIDIYIVMFGVVNE